MKHDCSNLQGGCENTMQCGMAINNSVVETKQYCWDLKQKKKSDKC